MLYLRAFRSPAKLRGLWAAQGWTCSSPPTSRPPGKPSSMSVIVAGRAASLCTTGRVMSAVYFNSPTKAALIGPQLILIFVKISVGCSSTYSVSVSVSVETSPSVKQPGRQSDHYLHLEPRTRISGAIPLLPPYVFEACTVPTCLHACLHEV